MLSIPDADATRVLRDFKWDVARAHEEWFADEGKIRRRCGLAVEEEEEERAEKKKKATRGAATAKAASAAKSDADAPPPATEPNADGTLSCLICFADYPPNDTRSAHCGHAYCTDCYSGFVKAAIEGGTACLDLRCPTPGCGAAVPETSRSSALPRRRSCARDTRRSRRVPLSKTTGGRCGARRRGASAPRRCWRAWT